MFFYKRFFYKYAFNFFYGIKFGQISLTQCGSQGGEGRKVQLEFLEIWIFLVPMVLFCNYMALFTAQANSLVKDMIWSKEVAACNMYTHRQHNVYRRPQCRCRTITEERHSGCCYKVESISRNWCLIALWKHHIDVSLIILSLP